MAGLPLFFALLLSAWAWGGLAVWSRPRTATPWENILLRYSWGWALLGLSLAALGEGGLPGRGARGPGTSSFLARPRRRAAA
jgi:hypothetical protein